MTIETDLDICKKCVEACFEEVDMGQEQEKPFGLRQIIDG